MIPPVVWYIEISVANGTNTIKRDSFSDCCREIIQRFCWQIANAKHFVPDHLYLPQIEQLARLAEDNPDKPTFKLLDTAYKLVGIPATHYVEFETTSTASVVVHFGDEQSCFQFVKMKILSEAADPNDLPSKLELLSDLEWVDLPSGDYFIWSY